jgi:hypothetical protein
VRLSAFESKISWFVPNGTEQYSFLHPDLFQGAILESGTFLSPWAFQRRAREIAFTTAAFLNSTFETSDDSQALLEFLQSVDARDLDAAAEKYHNMVSGTRWKIVQLIKARRSPVLRTWKFCKVSIGHRL